MRLICTIFVQERDLGKHCLILKIECSQDLSHAMHYPAIKQRLNSSLTVLALDSYLIASNCKYTEGLFFQFSIAFRLAVIIDLLFFTPHFIRFIWRLIIIIIIGYTPADV